MNLGNRKNLINLSRILSHQRESPIEVKEACGVGDMVKKTEAGEERKERERERENEKEDEDEDEYNCS